MASYYPMVKNSAQRIVFPILDADGDPVTGAASDTPDSEYSLDGASFSDCSDEIHEIATASGIYYLDLLAGETNGDVVCIQAKTATAATKTTVLVFYTSAQSLDTIDGNVDSILTDTNELQGLIASSKIAAQVKGIDDIDLSATMKTSVNAEVDTALSDVDLDHLIQVSAGAEEPTDGAYLDQIMHKDVSQTFDATTDSLEAIKDAGGGGPTAGEVADAVWDEPIADHTTSSQFGGKNQKVVPSETVGDYKATGFSTHAAADIWTEGSRELSTPANYKADVSNLDQAISTTESNIRGGTETLETVKSAISAIQNNTRFTAAVPVYMCKPDAGNEAFKWGCNVYDDQGNMEDPDDSEVMVRVSQDDGTYLYNLYKEVGLTNLLDNATDTTTWPSASGWRALERSDVGRFFAFYKCVNDATEETLTVEFGWEETGTEIYQVRSTEVADVHGDLTAILSDTGAIKTQTDKMGFDGSNYVSARVKATDDIDLSATQKTSVNAEVDTALSDIDIDHLVKTTYGGADPTVGSLMDLLLNKNGSQTFSQSTDSLEAIRDNQAVAGPSAATIADAVWDESIADHTTSSQFGGKNQKVVPSETIGDYKATGFSTHVAADVWTVVTRALTDKAGFSLSAAGIDSIIDEVIEGTITLRQAQRLCLAALAGKSTGGGGVTIAFRDNADGKDRISATVDANGNRTAVVLDTS